MEKTTASATMLPKAEKIGVGEKLAYGCGDLASNLVMVLTGTYMSFFYSEALGLSVGIIGTILLASRFFDGVSDILMGFIMDKTRSKHGKARCWMLWLAIPFGVCTLLLTTVPAMGDLGKYIYIFITYNLTTTVIYTAINIPYGALNSLMTRDQHQRESINVFRMTMAQIGGLAINAFTLPLVNSMGGSTSQTSWIMVSALYGVTAAGLFLLCFFKTKERVNVASEADRKLSFGKTLKTIVKNDQWLLLCVIWVVNVLGMSMGMGVGAYYCKYILLNENLFGFLAVILQGVGILCMPFMMPFVKKFGKRNVALVGTLISLVGQVMMVFNPVSFTWLAVCNVVKGVGSAPLMATLFAMMADTIEYGHWKTGIRVEGTLYSATTFGAKVGGGLGVAVALGILDVAGYIGSAATQVPMALDTLKALYIYAPIIFAVILPIIYFFYKLDKIYPKVMSDLAEREAKDGRK